MARQPHQQADQEPTPVGAESGGAAAPPEAPGDNSAPPPPAPAPAPFDVEGLFAELRDERLRSRHREAVWLSIIVHLVVIILILINPKLPSWLRSSPHEMVLGPQKTVQRHELTYLETPLKTPKPKQKVHSNVLSDRDRLLHRHQIPRLSLAAPSSPPPRHAALSTPARPPPPPPVKRAEVKPTPKQPAAGKSAAQGTQKADNGLELQDVPQVPKPQLSIPTPGLSAAAQLKRAIEEAAREHASGSQGIAEMSHLPDLPRPSNPGMNGPGGRGEVGNGVRILTDTEGVDFHSYLQRVIAAVRQNWYAVMPEMARLGRKGRVVIVFRIQRNGSVPGLSLTSPSGTQSFDQAALASINASDPFPPLPSQFHGPNITLQFSFFYNINPYQADLGQ